MWALFPIGAKASVGPGGSLPWRPVQGPPRDLVCLSRGVKALRSMNPQSLVSHHRLG